MAKERKTDHDKVFLELREEFINGDLIGEQKKRERILFAFHCRSCKSCQWALIRDQTKNVVQTTLLELADDLGWSVEEVLLSMGFQIQSGPTAQ